MSKMLEDLERKKAELAEKQKKLTQQIRAAKLRAGAKQRAIDTKKKILAGAMLMHQIEKGEWPKEKFLAAMDKFLTRKKDRELFFTDSSLSDKSCSDDRF